MVTIQPWVFIITCWSRQYNFNLVCHPFARIRTQDLSSTNLIHDEWALSVKKLKFCNNLVSSFIASRMSPTSFSAWRLDLSAVSSSSRASSNSLAKALPRKNYLLKLKKLQFKRNNVCCSAVTCKVLLNWPHSKLGQHCAVRFSILTRHDTGRRTCLELLCATLTPLCFNVLLCTK